MFPTAPRLHGIDMAAPDAVERLLEFHRAQFGDATMMAESDGGTAGGQEGAPEGQEQGQTGESAAERPEAAGDPAEGRGEAKEPAPTRAETEQERQAREDRIREEASAAVRADLIRALRGDDAEGDDAKDPAALAREIDALKAERDTYRAEAAATQAAHRLGADASRLLDSRSFAQSLAKIDPTDTKALDALVNETLTANPHLRINQGAGRSGAEFLGGTETKKTTPDTLAGAIDAHYGIR